MVLSSWELLTHSSTKVILGFDYFYSGSGHPMPDIGHITVGSDCIAPRDSVRNLGVQFDSIFSFEEHIKNICKSSFYHLRNIAKIRKYLSQDTCKILVHAFISSKLAHCNSLLYMAFLSIC